MTRSVNHEELKKLIKHLYIKKDEEGRKVPLIVYGTFGVGKSAVIKATGKDIAEERGRTFVEWNKVSKDDKEKIVKNPEKYFTLIDIRLSENDSSDIKGLPDFNGKDTIDWKVPFWAMLLEKEGSDGILFFDEINLAPPLVISSCYKIIYDRVIGESKINADWLIIGAGNNEEDMANTNPLAPPVRDRGCEVELKPAHADDWISNFAIPNKIDSRIIGFISWKGGNLHPKMNIEDGQKFTTERGWNRVNTLIRDTEDLKMVELSTSTAISEGIAREFVAFCKIRDNVKIEEIIKKPELLEKIHEISIRYFIVSALAEKYSDKKIDFQKVIEISEVLDRMGCAEFVTLMWRLSYRYAPERFRKDYTGNTKNETEKKIKAKYNKYLI